jgi:6-phosphogluconate dehydrogenase
MTYDPAVDSTAESLEELKEQLEPPRVTWLMVPSGDITEQTFQQVLGLADDGDTIVDGGNSYFRHSMRRHEEAAARGVHFVDVGVSGGIWGLQVGFCLMAGGDREAVEPLEPALRTLAPEDGYAHVGGPGAGHYVKMVHNGIEYGLMEAYGEGFDILHASDYDLDLAAVARLWNHGSVIRSWLLELAGNAFEREGNDLEGIAGWVADSGEGRWTVAEAIDHDVPAPIITLALLQRFRSRRPDSFTDRVLAALRNEFGGHAVKSTGADDKPG